ncbi:MAG: sortase-like acyltransferase [Clostridiales bacterium]|jgi:phosphinothricin acetyltransferase|nr:sortase-like acyltransferase [Clostridiales bacterium]
MDEVNIRLVNILDAKAILNIYAPYVVYTPITFEYDIPSIEEFEERIEHYTKTYPWIVCEIEGKIVGYAYASRYRAREAYDWSTEVTVYVDEEYQRYRIATALYTGILNLLTEQGYYMAYACVTRPNNKSELFHERMNFKEAGIHHKAGFKLNQWHDITYYEKKLAKEFDEPKKPKGPSELETNVVEEILLDAESLVKYKK